MLRFSGCKINLGLSVIGKRSDGFHDIETVFYPVPWYDVVEIIPSNKNVLRSYGITIPGNPDANFCLKAYHLLAKDFSLKPLEWTLLKNIPIGAGLGGGSANAAAALMLLNEYFDLSLSNDKLMDYASQIGSDCAFFIDNKPQFAAGRGNLFQSTSLSLKDYHLVIVFPNIHVNTAWAYSKLIEKNHYSRAGELAPVLKKNASVWKDELINDFESVVFPQYPVLLSLKQRLYQFGATYAAMSGSGSAIFGLFGNQLQAKEFIKHIASENYSTYWSKL